MCYGKVRLFLLYSRYINFLLTSARSGLTTVAGKLVQITRYLAARVDLSSLLIQQQRGVMEGCFSG